MKTYDVMQRSPEWYALRLGIPTASEFSKILTSKAEPSKSASGYALSLAAEKFAGKPLDQWEGNQWTERGREQEVHALELYAFANDVTIEPIGFVTDDAGTMGCSPDGLIGADGMAEVKCLKAENHIKAILYHQKNSHCPPDYVQQTQGQLLVCERAWCDLIFFHPDLPLLVIRQEADRQFHAALRRAIKGLSAERDEVLAALRAVEDGRAAYTLAPKVAARFTDLSQAAPVF